MAITQVPLKIVLQDEWLAYETRELVRLFVDLNMVQITIDPDIQSHSPVTPPGIVCDCGLAASGNQCRLRLETAEGITLRQISLPAGWQQHPDARREVKRLYQAALYDLLQRLTPVILPWGILTGVRPVKLAHQLLRQEKDPAGVIKRLTEDYRVSFPKASLLTDIVRVQLPVLQAVQSHQISLYIGIPLCPSRCSYCSFISQAVQGSEDPLIAAYTQALIKEMTGTLEWLSQKGWSIETVYIGGGTPSVLSAGQMDGLMAALADNWPMEQIQEITFEAGRPDTITREKLEILRRYRVNRLSINPQSLQPETLVRINRHHTVSRFFEAWQLAEEMGFETINMDLIIGLPGEGQAEVSRTLAAIAPLKPANLTVHALALKRSSQLKTDGSGHTLTDAEAGRIMDRIYAFAAEMQLSPYYLYRQKEMAGHLENVGFSLPGKEGLYNILMMEEKQTILGIGAGAVSKLYDPSRDRIDRIPHVKNIPLYIERIREKGFDKEAWTAAFPD
ncbi:MAG: coproporphyrinogen dehydrogenase HemZ [Bacillota bacterium]|nr:coproporphyrinogen dehydrogenase HemZ [Bacillota bacterium]MDW7677451.1 coproporphyrinogen dehydrogenase HemZ [Bacillota bacterium]